MSFECKTISAVPMSNYGEIFGNERSINATCGFSETGICDIIVNRGSIKTDFLGNISTPSAIVFAD